MYAPLSSIHYFERLRFSILVIGFDGYIHFIGFAWVIAAAMDVTTVAGEGAGDAYIDEVAHNKLINYTSGHGHVS